jgi:hypothetical protein
MVCWKAPLTSPNTSTGPDFAVTTTSEASGSDGSRQKHMSS